MIYVMNRVRKWKVYLTRRKKRHVILTKREEGLSQIRVFGVNLIIFPRITIKNMILRIKYPIILQHQNAGICLTILFKILNKGNVSNVGNVKDHITPSTVRIGRVTSRTYTLSRKKKRFEMWKTRCTG